MNIDNIDQEQLEALEEQTANICASLEFIEDHTPNDGTLDTLEEQTDNIYESLKFIEDHSPNDATLEAMEEQTANICAGLREIEELTGSFDLDRLEAQLDRIIGKLNKVKEG